MGLFSKTPADEALVRPSRTVSGAPVTDPESLQSVQRRVRLMAAAMRALQGDPVAEEVRRPIGDGIGMEGLVDKIRPIFTREQSLLPLVALRGAILFVDLLAPSNQEWEALTARMGIRYELDTATNGRIAYVNDPNNQIPFAAKGGVTGLTAAIAMRWSSYDEIEGMSLDALISSAHWTFNDAIALDFIAWAAVAALRSEPESRNRLANFPEPSALEVPGWYFDPLFAKSERYWDGSDWTARIRMSDGRRYSYGEVRLK
jgi:hypothetical protein